MWNEPRSIAVALALAAWPLAAAASPPDMGRHKIKHVIVIMQENRSFDH